MGMKLFSDDSVDPPNPDPLKFQILKMAHYDYAHVMLVHYPGCTTFDGKKILVYSYKFAPYKSRDPHFTFENKLIARFRPTSYGWFLADKFAKEYIHEDEVEESTL